MTALQFIVLLIVLGSGIALTIGTWAQLRNRPSPETTVNADVWATRSAKTLMAHPSDFGRHFHGYDRENVAQRRKGMGARGA
jgi:hypothetical protein